MGGDLFVKPGAYLQPNQKSGTGRSLELEKETRCLSSKEERGMYGKPVPMEKLEAAVNSSSGKNDINRSTLGKLGPDKKKP